MIFRRFILGAVTSLPLLTTLVGVAHAQAPSSTEAKAFITQAGNNLVSIVNGNDSAGQKSEALRQLVNQIVDVNQVADYVLGRYNDVATPDQKQKFHQLFQQLLSYNITYQIRSYKGVSFVVDNTAPQGNDIVVNTTITSPGKPAAIVGWVVESKAGKLYIIDVIAAGTSLRITTRNDYAGVIADNGGQVSALLNAMQNQIKKITAANGAT